MRSKIILIICGLFVAFTSVAQNNTKSVYSYYGIGEFQTQDANSTKGLAGNSFGLQPGLYPNLANPISIAGRKRVDFDFGFEFNNRLQQTSTAQKTAWAGNVNHVTLAFNVFHKTYERRDSTGKIKRKTPVRYNQMVGLAPYTAMDYDFAIEGDTATFRTLFSAGGNGGLNSLYWNHAFQVLDKQVSFGFSYQYLFGSLQESTLKNLIADSSSIGFEQNTNQRITGSWISVSAAYSGWLRSKSRLRQTINAQYSLSTDLSSRTNLMLRRVEDFFRVKDTLALSSPKGTISLPSSFRIGYGLQKANLWAVTLDYQNAAFSGYRHSLNRGRLVDFERYGAGFIINPNRATRRSGKKLDWYKKIELSTGIFYQTGPYAVEINNKLKAVPEYGISFGVGLPMTSRFGSRTSYVHLTAQYSRRGSTTDGLIQEDVLRINLGLNLSDIWFKRFNYN